MQPLRDRYAALTRTRAVCRALARNKREGGALPPHEDPPPLRMPELPVRTLQYAIKHLSFKRQLSDKATGSKMKTLSKPGNKEVALREFIASRDREMREAKRGKKVRPDFPSQNFALALR